MSVQSEHAAEIEAAKQAYFAGDPQATLDALETLIPELSEPSEIADANLFYGMSLIEVGREAEATAPLEVTVRNSPDLVPQEDLFPEAARTRFLELRATLIGRLEIRTNPPGATATVAGTEVGTTPFAGNFLVGEHRIRVELDDYHSYESLVNVEAGEVTFVESTMRMTPEAIRRAQEGASRNRKGSKKVTYALIGGGAAGGAVVALAATGSSREAGAPVTRTFQNTSPPFVPAGPFIVDVGSTGTLSINLTWDNPDAALFVEVRIVSAVFDTIRQVEPTGPTETRLTQPVEGGRIYQIWFQNRTTNVTTFTLSYTFPG